MNDLLIGYLYHHNCSLPVSAEDTITAILSPGLTLTLSPNPNPNSDPNHRGLGE